jgi:hypothetical protein
MTIIALAHDQTAVSIVGDSQLSVHQASGTWKCKQDDLKRYRAEFQTLKGRFRSLEIRYGPRDKNLAGQYIERLQAGR